MSRSIRIVSIATLIAACLILYGMDPVPPIPKMYGIYTTLKPGRYGIGGSEYHGVELFVTWGPYVFIQYADGRLHPPAVVKADMHFGQYNLEFDVPAEVGPLGHFQGTIDEGRIIGTFKGNGEKVMLPKRLSVWQK